MLGIGARVADWCTLFGLWAYSPFGGSQPSATRRDESTLNGWSSFPRISDDVGAGVSDNVLARFTGLMWSQSSSTSRQLLAPSHFAQLMLM